MPPWSELKIDTLDDIIRDARLAGDSNLVSDTIYLKERAKAHEARQTRHGAYVIPEPWSWDVFNGLQEAPCSIDTAVNTDGHIEDWELCSESRQCGAGSICMAPDDENDDENDGVDYRCVNCNSLNMLPPNVYAEIPGCGIQRLGS
tara:strand:- start:38 stop:475 length:438 start_codon:yes stop_codon:yes gene_type:complete